MLMQRLRALDRKVLGSPRPTPERWRRNASRWWIGLAAANVLVVVAVVTTFLTGEGGAVILTFTAVLLAFEAGQLRAEHARLEGRDVFAKVRPLED